MNKITVIDFVNKCNSYNSEAAKKKYIESMVCKDKYVDYLVKVQYSNNILQTSCIDKNGDIKLNSCKKYMLYINVLLTLYTYIEIPDNEMVKSFDLLDRYGLIDEIMKYIPEKEKVTFDTVLKMCYDDMMTNYYEPHSFINRKLNESYPKLAQAITPFLKALSIKLDQLDENKILGMIKNISN